MGVVRCTCHNINRKVLVRDDSVENDELFCEIRHDIYCNNNSCYYGVFFSSSVCVQVSIRPDRVSSLPSWRKKDWKERTRILWTWSTLQAGPRDIYTHWDTRTSIQTEEVRRSLVAAISTKVTKLQEWSKSVSCHIMLLLTMLS